MESQFLIMDFRLSPTESVLFVLLSRYCSSCFAYVVMWILFTSSDALGNALVRVYATIGSLLGTAPQLYASSPTVAMGAGQPSLSLALGRMTLHAQSLSLCLLACSFAGRAPCCLTWYEQN